MIFLKLTTVIYIYISVDYSFMEWQKDKQNSFWIEEEEMMSKTKMIQKHVPIVYLYQSRDKYYYSTTTKPTTNST